MKFRAGDLSQIALFAALTAVGAFIRIPLPIVPFTLQTFFVSLAGILLGAKKGMLSQLLYVCIGLLGVPVFTKGGGIGYVFQPTFGYLIGFIVSAYVIGLCVEHMKKINTVKVYIVAIAGLIIVYLAGVPYLYLLTNIYLGNAMPIGKAFYYGFVLSIGGDLLSLYLASLVAVKLLPILRKSGLIPEREINGSR